MLHKILKILVALISVAGVIFLGLIMFAGDKQIKAAAVDGNTLSVDLISIPAYIMLGLILLFVIFFVIKNLVTNTSNLKGILIGGGAFIAVLVISYILSDTENPVLSTGENLFRYADKTATSNEIQTTGAGLIAFYVLLFVAIVSMAASGVKKMLAK